jgi:hypothetical protein
MLEEAFEKNEVVNGIINGKVKGGQHLKYPDNTPLSSLLLTIVNRAGIEVDKVGDDGMKVLSEV